jgi:hypothetical protein
MTDEEWERWRRESRPLGFGPVLRVDTTGPVDVPAVVTWLQARRPGASRQGGQPA